MDRWISVEDKMPNDYRNVLVFSYEYNDIDVACYISEWNQWRDGNDKIVDGIDCWMELPPKPFEDDEEIYLEDNDDK